MPDQELKAKALANGLGADGAAGPDSRGSGHPTAADGAPHQDGANRGREEKKGEPSPGARLRELLRTSIGMAVTFDERGTIETLDGTVEMLLGYGSRELIGHSVVEILTLDHERPVMDADCHARLRRKDGSTFPAKLT